MTITHENKKQRRIIKNIKLCQLGLHRVYTQFALDVEAYEFFSKLLHRNIWKLQENKNDTDSEYESDATVDFDIDLPNEPIINSGDELILNSDDELILNSTLDDEEDKENEENEENEN